MNPGMSRIVSSSLKTYPKWVSTFCRTVDRKYLMFLWVSIAQIESASSFVRVNLVTGRNNKPEESCVYADVRTGSAAGTAVYNSPA